MIQSKNPYTEQLQKAIKDNDEEKIRELELKSHEYITSELQKVTENIEVVTQMHDNIKKETKKSDVKFRPLLKQSIETYRLSVETTKKMTKLDKIKHIALINYRKRLEKCNKDELINIIVDVSKRFFMYDTIEVHNKHLKVKE